MNLARLRRMSLAEVACRGRQEVSKRLELVSRSREDPARLASPLAPRLLEEFKDSIPRRFFEGAVSADTPALLAALMPEDRAEALARADQGVCGRFDLLGYRGLSFGRPVDWHLDPIHGRRSPLVHWSRIDPLDATVVGDSKVIWELNRHQWLVWLGQGYRLTRAPVYARAFADSVEQWLAANPRGQGINWSSSLEVALRTLSWCWALALFRDAECLTAELFARLRASVRQHAAHVEKYLSHYFSPNTHLTAEALGLVYAGTVFPDLEEAEHWRALGAQILADQCERQVLPDGVYFEQSTCYQRYTVEIYLHFLLLSARSGGRVPPVVGERVQQMLDFLLAMRRPDGGVPQIGDADGGFLLPLARREPEDLRGVFSVAAAHFGRSDYAWAACGATPELVWLLGPRGLDRFDALVPAPPEAPPSRVFPEGGYVVMRSGWERDGHQLILDVGPLGCPVSGGHGHADLLSLQCSAFGEPFLVDPGTYVYNGQRAWRDYFRSTAAHSTVVVDGASQAEPAATFAWQERPRAELRLWHSTQTLDLAEAGHAAYRRLPDPVSHKRRVIFVKPRYFVIVDDLEGAAEHRVELRFQFAPLPVSVEDDQWIRARAPGGSGLLLRSLASVPLQTAIVAGASDPIAGWVSAGYGRREPAPLLICSTVARLPLRVFSVLLPIRDASSAPPAVSLLEREGRGPIGVTVNGEETVFFVTEASEDPCVASPASSG
jgi:hypothetical protein